MSPSSRSIPGTEELGQLYHAIGFALAQWQFIEAEMGRLLIAIVRSENGAVNSSFFAVDNFRSKMEMVNAAAQQVLIMQRSLLQEWNALYKTLDSNRKARNNLAHFSVVVRGDLEATKHVYFLEPTWFDVSNYFDEKATAYHFEDVKHLGFKFDETSREIAEFAKKVRLLFPSSQQ